MTTHTPQPPDPVRLPADEVLRLIDKRSYGVLASTSPAGRSHSAGVLYSRTGSSLVFSTMRSSRKARNVAANPHVAMTIPVRRVPVGGPPSAIMFQGRAEILDLDDRWLRSQADAGHLKSITGHGELELAGGCFVRIDLPDRVVTYGLGMSLLSLIRDPLNASGWSDLSTVHRAAGHRAAGAGLCVAVS